jgi:hypothetical protein
MWPQWAGPATSFADSITEGRILYGAISSGFLAKLPSKPRLHATRSSVLMWTISAKDLRPQ